MRKIIVIGNEHSANLLNEYIKQDNRYYIEAFSVDAEFITENTLFSRPVLDLEKLQSHYHPEGWTVLIAIGYGNLNRNRENIFVRLKNMGYTIETYIHPDAKVYSSDIGEGSIIMPNSFIDVQSKIGVNTVVWGNCSISHHAEVGPHCWVATGSVISGNAVIGTNSFIGVSATIVNNVKIGTHNIIGAGSLIVKDTDDYKVYISRQTEEFRFGAEDYLRFTKI